jgi:hypothetical protein
LLWVVCRVQKQKTRREGRVFVDTREKRATAYPARIQGSGRRAREVMPAAMRALVRMTGGRAKAGIVPYGWAGRSAKKYTVSCRNATTAVQSAGCTFTLTRSRSPGS